MVSLQAIPDLADVQGNLLQGYRLAMVRHLVLAVHDRRRAGDWLLAATGGDATHAPQVTTARRWEVKAPSCLNVGISHAGLGALGLGAASLSTFPPEFRGGMASRAVKLGDTGPSDPAQWNDAWRDASRVHLLVSLYADQRDALDELARRVLDSGGFSLLAQLDGQQFPGDRVHFGYRDNIAQPHIAGVRDPADRLDRQPAAEIGAVLLGYPTPLEDVTWELPSPSVLGVNGSFNAFRVLEQRVEEFEAFLSESAEILLRHAVADELLAPGVEATWDPPLSRTEAFRELVAAKVLGRWRNGVPLALSPTTPTPERPLGPGGLNDFGYRDDPDGLRCPLGSHIRRCNPRDAQIVQRSTNHYRRIVRRGAPYGPPFDPAHPDGEERGLLGQFICASLTVQFEAIQYDWMNLGLQDPRITGTNDAIVGNNESAFSSFTLPIGRSSIELRGFPRFVRTRGGEYFFMPSISCLRVLGDVAR